MLHLVLRITKEGMLESGIELTTLGVMKWLPMDGSVLHPLYRGELASPKLLR